MKFKGNTADDFTVKLLGWFFGRRLNEVREMEWTEDEVKRAEAYMIEKHEDIEAYWRE